MYRHRFTHFTDALIPVYNWGFNVLGGRGHEAFRRRVLELADLEDGECLLDAGCGTGMLALRIAAQYLDCTVHGIDLSSKMIAVARRDAETQGLAVDFRVGSITDLPYPDGSFDIESQTSCTITSTWRRSGRLWVKSRACYVALSLSEGSPAGATSRPSLDHVPATRCNATWPKASTRFIHPI
jgi:SAM-dependent methyltransferase